MLINPIMLALSRKSKGISRVDLIGEPVPMDGTNMEISDTAIIDVLDQTCGPLQVDLTIESDIGMTIISAIFAYSISNGEQMYQFTLGPVLFTISKSYGGKWSIHGTTNTA